MAASGDVSGQIALDANALASLKLQAKSDPKKALSAAAGQFEALFMQMLLKSMREALPKDGPLESESTKAYTGMFDQQIAQQLAKKGIGVADMLVKQLSATLKPAANGAASGSDGSLQPKALPLATKTSATTTSARSAASVSPATAAAPASVSATVQGFIDKLRPYAEAVAQKMGVPAQYLIAQAGLETGWGKSLPKSADGTDSRNLFGVKAGSTWKAAVVQATTTEYVAGRAEKTQAGFRSYSSYAESLQDFAKLLQTSRRYAGALANTHDAGKYAASLQKAGYATDPHYGEKLARAIETVARHAPIVAKPSPAQVVAGTADKRLDLV